MILSRSEKERLVSMSYDELWDLISFSSYGDKYDSPSESSVKTAKLIIERCPERTLDVCRIMDNKTIHHTAKLWFDNARQAVQGQRLRA